MLHDDAGRPVEAVHQSPSRLRVEQVEVAQRLAAVLNGLVPPSRLPPDPVAGRHLVRVLPVPQVLGPLQVESQMRRQEQLIRRRLGRFVGVGPIEPLDDLCVVGGGELEGPPRQPTPRSRRDTAAGAQLLQDRLVVARIEEDPDVGVVLGGGPHHRRSTDVDELDAGVNVERIQPGDDQRDRFDAVFLQVPLVIRVVGVGEDAAVDQRVKCHNSVAEDRGEAGELGNVGDRNTCLADGPRRATTRDQLPAELVQTPAPVRRCPVCRTRTAGRSARGEGNETDGTQ